MISDLRQDMLVLQMLEVLKITWYLYLFKFTAVAIAYAGIKGDGFDLEEAQIGLLSLCVSRTPDGNQGIL